MMKKKSPIFELIEIVFLGVLISFILLRFLIMPCRVDGSSMFPNLHSGDLGYSFIISRNISLNRFDTVVIKVTSDNSEKLLVKRIIGMPNDTVRFEDNVLYINNQKYDEPYLNENAFTDDLEISLGEDEYFVMGDNRNVSRDSRYYGAFNGEDIVASHLLVIYPFNSIGFKK